MKPIEARTFCDYEFLSNPLLSPNGKRTAYVVQRTDLKENRYLGDLYLVEHDTGKSHRVTAGGDAKAFVWTRDGKLLFSAPRTEAYEQAKRDCRPFTAYYAIDPDGGEAQLYATLPLDAGLPTILEDGRWIVSSRLDLNLPDFDALRGSERELARSDYRRPRYETFRELPFWSNVTGYTSGWRTSLFLCDPKTWEITRITPKLLDVSFYDCAHGKVVYTGAEYQDVTDFYKGLFCYDVASGRTETLIPQGTYETARPCLIDENTVIVGLAPKYAYNYVFADFYRVDLRSKAVEKIADYDALAGVNSLTTDSKLGGGQTMKVYDHRLYFTSVEEGDVYLRSIDRDGNLSGRLTAPGSVDSFDVGPSGLVVCAMRGLALDELYLVEEGAKERRLTHHNVFVTRDYAVAAPVPLRYTGSDGWEIHGWVMPPAGYQAGKSYPAVLYIHGGPKAAFGAIFHHELQCLSSAGYFVLFCNPRGGDGRGEAFADLGTVIGTVDYVNLMEFTDECLKAYPEIDAARVGVAGGSYGGFMVNWILGHSGRFAAAVSQRGISNWITMEGTDDLGYIANRFQFGVMTDSGAEKLWECSPIRYAHNATTPTLFLHSDHDFRCPMSETLQMFTALRTHGVKARMVLFHGENHNLSRQGQPQNRLTRLEEILAWFDRYLGA